MSKVPANFIGLSTTIGIQQPIGTYGGQIYLQKWCQPMVFPDVLYWPINYYHRYLKTYRHLCYIQKWCQPMVEIVFPDEIICNISLGIFICSEKKRTHFEEPALPPPPPPHRSSPHHRRHYGPRDRRSDELTEVGDASYRGPI